jgi:hypothetical protein
MPSSRSEPLYIDHEEVTEIIWTYDVTWRESSIGCRSLTALPERLSECTALETLNLHGCRSLTALPERLGECVALKTLDLLLCSCPRSWVGTSTR